MRYCTVDEIPLEEKEKCVHNDPQYTDECCSVLMALKKKGLKHTDCEYYKEYVAPPKKTAKDITYKALKNVLKPYFTEKELTPNKIFETIKDLAEITSNRRE